jgi:multidrug efflux pump subunit AcrA (membrane-fusion protein)
MPTTRIRTILVGLLLALVLTGCGSEPVEQERVIRPVRYQQVFATGGRRVRSFSGVVQAGTESTLSFKVDGTVQRVAVRVGDKVAAGELIAQLDASDYQLRVQQAEATLRRARAEARNAASSYERVRLLYENNNASLNDLDAAQAGAESAEAAVASSEKNLQLLRLQLGYTRLVAPIAVMLASGARPKVVVSVPELLITQIRAGSPVEVRCDAMPGQLLAATVTEVGVTTARMETTYPVTVLLDEANADLRPGMAAEVAFAFESSGDRELILVPPVAVGEDRQGRFVFVVKPTRSGLGVVERREVRIGELTRNGLEVTEGLEDGELVVTAGVSRIQDGLTVKVPGQGEDPS